MEPRLGLDGPVPGTRESSHSFRIDGLPVGDLIENRVGVVHACHGLLKEANFDGLGPESKGKPILVSPKLFEMLTKGSKKAWAIQIAQSVAKVVQRANRLAETDARMLRNLDQIVFALKTAL